MAIMAIVLEPGTVIPKFPDEEDASMPALIRKAADKEAVLHVTI